jgi:hypothetical protein
MRALPLVCLLAACGPVEPGVPVALRASLSAGQVRSALVLVLAGDGATCDRALRLASPLDDPELDVVAHALYVVDGTVKRLGGLPADTRLTFYGEAFDNPEGRRPLIGRGCTEVTLPAGRAEGVTLVLRDP